MEIIIPLPNNSSANTYQELKSYLKQLELAVHYAQKSVEHAEKDGIEVTENSFISFQHPSLDNFDIKKIDVDKGIMSDLFYDEMQNIALRIYLA